MNQNLVELDLSDNAFGAAGVRPLCRLLGQKRDIQILKLNNVGLGTEGVKLVSQSLRAGAAVGALALRTLELGRNRFESQGAAYLSVAINSLSGSLKELRIYENSIRPDALPGLMKSLQSCHKLESLDLQDNTLLEQGSNSLAVSLGSWPDLRLLNVGDCLMGAEGVICLLQALQDGVPLLANLNISFNGMDPDASKLLPAFVQSHPRIDHLYVDSNSFNPDGHVILAVKEILQRHGHPNALEDLDEMDSNSEN
jgi:Ran GTPase-activating protein 1